jgi:hypothetical protein
MDTPFAIRRPPLAVLLGLLFACGTGAGPARADVLTSRLVDPSPLPGPTARHEPLDARIVYRQRREDDLPETMDAQAPLSPLTALALILVVPAHYTSASSPSSSGGASTNSAAIASSSAKVAGGPGNPDGPGTPDGNTPDGPPPDLAPEPGSLVLGLFGLAALIVPGRRRFLRSALCPV